YILDKKIKKEEVFKGDKNQLSFNLFLTSFFVLSYILWQYMYSIQRYIVVLEFLAPVLLFFFLNAFGFTKKTSAGIFIALSISIICYAIPMDFGRMPWKDSYFGVKVPAIKELETAN